MRHILRGSRHREGKSSPWLRALLATMPQPDLRSFRPVLLAEVELSRPLPWLQSARHVTARVLVRLHGQPLGTITMSLSGGPVGPLRLAAAIREHLDSPLEQHLRADGADPVAMERLAEGIDTVSCAAAPNATADRPFVSIVVATRDRPDMLARCIDSLISMQYPHFEVVVVDNAPRDDRARGLIAERFADHNVRYEVEPCPGVSRARNSGFRVAEGELVAFIDDDEVADSLWIDALVSGFSHEGVTCVTGLTLPMELQTAAQEWFECYGGFARGYDLRLYDLDVNRGETRFYPYTAGIFGSSANVAFRRAALLEIGGFDPVLGGGTLAFAAEDLDAFLSLLFRGDRIAYEPSAIVRHQHRREYEALQWQLFTYSAALVGLMLKRAFLDRRVALDMLRRLPRILPTALRARRGAGQSDRNDYPLQLRLTEVAGYLYGPVAYLRSRAAAAETRPAMSPDRCVG